MNDDYIKALLYSYPALGKIEEAVSVSVTNQALLSYRSVRPAEEIAGEIAGEMRVRAALSSLRLLTEKILSVLSEEENYLLEYKYFRRKRMLRERYGRMSLTCSERTYFRRQERLLQKICIYFVLHGWTEERFLRETGGLFCRVLHAIGEGRERAVKKRRFGRANRQSSV